MNFEYPEKRLYNQLLYFGGLWDVEKAKTKAKGLREYDAIKERVVVLAETNRELFGSLKAVVDAYAKKCGRQWVDMGGLFGFAAK
jgi:DNA polymerase alpha subunit A